MNNATIAFIFALTLVIGAGFAPQRATAQSSEIIELEEILVSGGLTPLSAQSLGRAHTVLTRADLAAARISSAADALRLVPGLSIGGNGDSAATQVRMRGAEGNHVLVLIDGIKVSDPNLDEFYWEGIPASIIEKIEIIRGPQSSIHGSNALAGIIAITTRPDAESGSTASIEAGTPRSHQLHASTALSTTSGKYQLSISRLADEGVDVSGRDGEKDGIRSTTPALFAQFDNGDGLTLDGSVRYIHRTSQYDATDPDPAFVLIDADNELERREVNAAVNLEFTRPGSAIRHSPSIATTWMHREARDATPAARRAARHRVAYQLDWALDGSGPDWSKHLLSAALDWERSDNRGCETASWLGLTCDLGNPEYYRNTRTQKGITAEYRRRWDDGTAFQLALRHDRHDRFGPATTGSAALSMPLRGRGLRMHAALGTAATNPTFTEQFAYATGTFRANPDLTPETSRGLDLGIAWDSEDGRMGVDITAFAQDLDDEIISVFQNGAFVPVNQRGRSRRRGVELSVYARPSRRLTLDANYTLVNTRDPDGTIEIRRARHTANLRGSWTLPGDHTDLHLTVSYRGDMEDTDFRTFPSRRVTLGSRAVVSLGMIHRATPRVEVSFRVENLLDETIEDVFGYFGKGRRGTLGLRTDF